MANVADFVSTGWLPDAPEVQSLVEEACSEAAEHQQGQVSPVYPALGRVDPKLLGACVVDVRGGIYPVGDADHPFTIMSVSKPFIFALICDAIGPDEARRKIGANATGYPFNSLAGAERAPDGRTNPMVNAGAIATTSLVPGSSMEERWQWIHQGLSHFAGRALPMNEEVLASARETNFRNRGLAHFLRSVDALYSDPLDAVDLYTRQCSLNVTAKDLAVMGATLADGGVNPITGKRVVQAMTCHYTLAVMATAGLYETSGDWLYEIGLPGKSGIGGGIVTVSPGKGALGTFAPRLDSAGNSVQGQILARHLSRRLGLDLFISSPTAEGQKQRELGS